MTLLFGSEGSRLAGNLEWLFHHETTLSAVAGTTVLQQSSILPSEDILATYEGSSAEDGLKKRVNFFKSVKVHPPKRTIALNGPKEITLFLDEPVDIPLTVSNEEITIAMKNIRY